MGALAKKRIVNLYNRQKMRTFIVILATIALCTALPSTEDEIVPEMSLIQAKEEYDAHADAVASLEFLQTTEGRSKNACESLAKDTLKEIDNSIKTQQNMLNKLYKGERCHLEGKAAYDQAKRRKTDADRKLSTANKRLRDASNYQVDFGRYTFSGLREGSCGAFYNDRSYVNAKANYKRRQREQTQATGAQKTAVKNQNDARAAHLKAVEKCRCAVKDQHAKGWTAANRNNANNAKAWKKAKHMLCVLADTPESRCNTGGLRRLSKPRLHSSVTNVRCDKNTCTGHVSVYQHNFSGWVARFKRGSYNIHAFKAKGARNDDASSVIVPRGCKATLYEHGQFNGWAVTVGEGRHDLNSLRRRGFKNDRMSSIRVNNA